MVPLEFYIDQIITYRRLVLRNRTGTSEFEQVGMVEERGQVTRIDSSSVILRSEMGVLYRVYFKDIL